MRVSNGWLGVVNLRLWVVHWTRPVCKILGCCRVAPCMQDPGCVRNANPKKTQRGCKDGGVQRRAGVASSLYHGEGSARAKGGAQREKGQKSVLRPLGKNGGIGLMKAVRPLKCGKGEAIWIAVENATRRQLARGGGGARAWVQEVGMPQRSCSSSMQQ
jgi:hypothetical protein